MNSFLAKFHEEEKPDCKSSTSWKRRGFQETEHQSRTCDPFMSQHEFIMQRNALMKAAAGYLEKES